MQRGLGCGGAAARLRQGREQAGLADEQILAAVEEAGFDEGAHPERELGRYGLGVGDRRPASIACMQHERASNNPVC